MNAAVTEAVRTIETGRGIWGMRLFVATEAMLFALMFFAYFYLGATQAQWPLEEDPSYKYALILLAILIVSSFTAAWGESGIESGRTGRLQLGLAATLVLGIVFLGVQALEYRIHLRTLRPTDNAYGSIFYTITSFHLAHLLLGLLFLLFAFVRSFAGHFSRERHLAVKNSVFYWHFVDIVWIFIVTILYILPHLHGK